MGAPYVPKPKAPPAPVDRTKAMIAALNYEAMQRQIRTSSGRSGMFLTGKPTGGLLGQ